MECASPAESVPDTDWWLADLPQPWIKPRSAGGRRKCYHYTTQPTGSLGPIVILWMQCQAQSWTVSSILIDLLIRKDIIKSWFVYNSGVTTGPADSSPMGGSILKIGLKNFQIYVQFNDGPRTKNYIRVDAPQNPMPHRIPNGTRSFLLSFKNLIE